MYTECLLEDGENVPEAVHELQKHFQVDAARKLIMENLKGVEM